MSPKKRTVRKSPKPSRAPAKRQILLVDDHPMTRMGLAENINRQADMKVCGEASSPAEAITALVKLKPDLMVTDLTMPGRSGIEFIKDIHALRPGLPLLVLSMHDETLHAERALRAGARAYLMKDAGAPKVLEVIRLVLSGQAYISPEMSGRMLDALTGRHPRDSGSPIAKLSDREFEVFQLLGSGKTTKDIALVLNLSPKTVDVHRAHLKQKLQLKNSTTLLHHAVRWVETQAEPEAARARPSTRR